MGNRSRNTGTVIVSKMTDQECLTYFGKTLEQARSDAEAMEAHRKAFIDRCSQVTVRVTDLTEGK